MSIVIPGELGPRIIKDKMKFSCFMHNRGEKLLLFLVEEHKEQVILSSRTRQISEMMRPMIDNNQESGNS
jgi:hypothetical protein